MSISDNLPTKEELYRLDMIKRLHDDRCWPGFALDYEGCPICGVLVSRRMKEIHITWHEVNNA